MLTAEQCERITIETFVNDIEAFDRLASTNDYALQCSREGKRSKPLLVVTQQQIKGRGRGKNQWWSGKGSLTFSLLVDSAASLQSARPSPLTSLIVGVAVCEALLALCGDIDVKVKWPNDVYIRGRKVAGILIECPTHVGSDVVIGIGLNVNNTIQAAPQELANTATTLLDEMGQEYPLDRVLIQLLQHLEEGFSQQTFASRFRELCILTDKQVIIDVGNRTFSGLCTGIDEDGALVLQTEDGPEKIVAGVIRSFV
jgi:BirA family biotin operon repressor/biotin-[acetyl-CoA-carboxylase] ligase